jgi:hypothetical protein
LFADLRVFDDLIGFLSRCGGNRCCEFSVVMDNQSPGTKNCCQLSSKCMFDSSPIPPVKFYGFSIVFFTALCPEAKITERDFLRPTQSSSTYGWSGRREPFSISFLGIGTCCESRFPHFTRANESTLFYPLSAVSLLGAWRPIWDR